MGGQAVIRGIIGASHRWVEDDVLVVSGQDYIVCELKRWRLEVGDTILDQERVVRGHRRRLDVKLGGFKKGFAAAEYLIEDAENKLDRGQAICVAAKGLVKSAYSH